MTVLQDATIDLRELQGDELADRAKYAELVMKVRVRLSRSIGRPHTDVVISLQCLWKVSKTVKESLENLQLRAPRLLRDINQFLITIPPAEWRRRANDDVPLADMPLRTVKTILQQVVSVMKEKVFNELDEIDQAENSFVYQYLYRLANQLSGGETALRAEALARKASASSLGSATREEAGSAKASTDSSSAQSASAVGPAPPASSPGGTDIAVNQRLKEIFELIGDPSHSRSVSPDKVSLHLHSFVLISLGPKTGYCSFVRVPKGSPGGFSSHRDLVRLLPTTLNLQARETDRGFFFSTGWRVPAATSRPI